MVKGLKSHITGAIWDVDPAALPAWAGGPVRLVRILYAVVRDLGDGMLSLRAMSLVYATLLSLVPLLAISFSVLKGLGVLRVLGVSNLDAASGAGTGRGGLELGAC